LFRALGFLNDRDGEFQSAEDGHREFPFANGVDYPKFTVKECLAYRKGDSGKDDMINASTDSLQVAPGGNGEIRMVPRFMLDYSGEIQDYMRKDSSGLKDFDIEEDNFAARRAVVHSGKKVAHSGKKAVSSVSRTAVKTATEITKGTQKAVSSVSKTAALAATELTEITGLHHVVNPIMNNAVTPITKNIVTPISHTIQSGISTGVKGTIAGVHHVSNGVHQVMDAGYSATRRNIRSSLSDVDDLHNLRSEFYDSDSSRRGIFDSGGMQDSFRSSATVRDDSENLMLFPEQNVDVEGPSTGKKLTDDLTEVKDKINDMTWHQFDDKLYTIKNPKALYFGQAKKPERRRKNDVPREIESEYLYRFDDLPASVRPF
jgi:hypothetical protein